jgi:hypothetical protein
MFFGSAAHSLVIFPSKIFGLRMVMQMEVADLYMEGLQLKWRFEILTEVLKKIQVFLELNYRSANLFEISLFIGFKVDSSFAYWIVILNLICLIPAVCCDAQPSVDVLWHLLSYSQSHKYLCT